MQFKFLGVFASAALALSLATAGQAATVYSAVSDFDSTTASGTPWSYGSIVSGVFTPFTVNRECFTGLSCWQTTTPDLETPVVAKNISGGPNNYGTITQPVNVLNLHPGRAAGQDTIVRFTAPSAGAYQLSGFFQIIDHSPTGVNVSIDGGAPVFLSAYGQTQNFAATLHLLAAQQVDFRVNNAGNFFNDSTGLSATFTAGIPEPATWAFMLMGFGAVGAGLRSRRSIASA